MPKSVEIEKMRSWLQHKTELQQVRKKYVKMMVRHPEIKHLALNVLFFTTLHHYQKKSDVRMDPNMTPDSLQIGAGGLPKAMQKKKNMNFDTQKTQESDVETKLTQNSLPKMEIPA